MSRTLKRVPTSFDWPLNRTWTGYVNPYHQLAGECPDCDHGCDRIGGRPDANAALFSDQWYGNAPFDPVAYGAAPLAIDDPAIRAFAERNVAHAPDYYMTTAERRAERENLQRAGVDLMELYKTTEELKAELDRPAGDVESLEQPGLVKIGGHRGAAIEREVRRLHDLWRGQWQHQLIQADVDALVEARRLPDFTHRPRTPEQAAALTAQAADGGSGYWLAEPNGYHPTAAEVNAWSFSGFGHDAINNGVCVEARCAREGVPYLCVRCKGTGTIWPSPEIERMCEEWMPTDPPSGDGYQLWSTTSEGCPVSPVFVSLEELCTWAAEHATTFASNRATAEQWRQMLEADFVHATDKHGNVYR